MLPGSVGGGRSETGKHEHMFALRPMDVLTYTDEHHGNDEEE